jgi:hypothetical protein
MKGVNDCEFSLFISLFIRDSSMDLRHACRMLGSLPGSGDAAVNINPSPPFRFLPDRRAALHLRQEPTPRFHGFQ